MDIKYISLEQALEALKAAAWFDNADRIVAECCLRNIPAADVRPERHGHWVYHRDIHGASYFCSACTCGVSDTNTENYCHYCGAIMDEKGE